MEMFGRLTADAQVKQLKDDRKVVNFTVAINDSYRHNGANVKKTLYVQCAYWINAGIAEYLTKGTMVELTGRLEVNVYNNMDGEARGNLVCHVDRIKLHGGGGAKDSAASRRQDIQPVTAGEAPADDLPF